MLTTLRAKMRPILLVTTIIVIPAFIVLYGVRGRSRGAERMPATVGEIWGEPVTLTDLWNARRWVYMDIIFRHGPQVAQQYVLPQTDLLEEAWKFLVKYRTAVRLGYAVSNEELRDRIIRMFGTAEGGFSRERYERTLATYRYPVAAFEYDLRRAMTVEKAEMDAAMALLPPSELELALARQFETAEGRLANFSIRTYLDGIEVSEEEARAYYEEHKTEPLFELPERIVLRYSAFDPADFREGVSVSDEEVASYYERNLSNYTEPEKVRARHILVRVDPEATAEEREAARRKAEALLERLRAGEDFAALAKENSDDPGSAAQGGDLGEFARGTMVKAFEDAAFALEPGQTSEIVETMYGYHIIRVEEKKPGRTRPLEEVGEEIREHLIGIQASSAAEDAAYELFYEAEDTGSLEEAARSLGVETQVTEPFALGEEIPGIGSDFALTQLLFDLPEGAIPDVTELGGVYYVFQVERKEAPRMARFGEVRDKAMAMVRRERAMKMAGDAAQRFSEALLAGASFDEAAEGAGGTVSETGPFNRANGMVKGLGYAPKVVEAAFAVGPGKVTQPVEYPSGYAAVWVYRINPPDEEQVKSQERFITQSVLTQRASRLAREWFHAMERLAKPKANPKAMEWLREREGA